jgi:heme/copper-type cytochrome/quinol oxidase subunit 1
MKLTPPKNLTFWIAVLLVLLGFLAKIVSIPVLSPFSFWLVFVGFVLLVLGLLVKGL